MAAIPLNPSKISKCGRVANKFVLFSAVINLANYYLTSIIAILHLDAKTKENPFKNDTKKP